MPKRILVVADDPALSRVLFDNFTFDGFEVMCVADEVRARQAVGTFAPDLVVLDAGLSDGDATPLTTQLRADRPTPVLVLTTQSRRAAPLASRTGDAGGRTEPVGGVSDLLPKPFDLDELLDRARGLLAARLIES